MSAKLDIIVVGATGYTGRITCKYLHSIKERAGRWGIAGRNAAKLEELKKELNADVPTFVVDATKPETLDAVCRNASCIAACAGPFTTVGMPVVEACVRNGTHYVDTAGEFNFVRRVVERFHEEAKEKGICVVSCCAYNAVPVDMGNYVLHEEAKEPVVSVRAYYDATSAGFSSGTYHSVCTALDNSEKADNSGDSLVPKDAVQPRALPTQILPWYYGDDGKFTAPYLMGVTDERVVRRSNALRGSSASFQEVLQAGAMKSVALALDYYWTGMTLVIPFLRSYKSRTQFKKGSTEGPTEEQKKHSFYNLTLIGHTESGKTVTTKVSDKRDVYDATGLFLAECALSAVTLSKHNAIKGGVLTPSTAFGDELVRRSREAGVSILSTVVAGAAAKNS